jgi:hypothetical protein
MEIWTRQSDQLGWIPWPAIPQGLAAIAAVPGARQALLVTTAPDADHPAVVAVLQLIQTLGRCEVTVASPHPSTDWAESLEPLGVDHLWVVDQGPMDRAARVGNPTEVRGNICHHLHTKTRGTTTLSVCGCHHDRLVLARYHLETWCLTGGDGCPHLHGDGFDD